MPHTTAPITLSVPLFFMEEMNAFFGKPGRVFPSQQATANSRWPRTTWTIPRMHRDRLSERAKDLAAELRARVATLEVFATDEGAQVLAEVAGAPGRVVGFLPNRRGQVWSFICPKERLATLQALASVLADNPTPR